MLEESDLSRGPFFHFKFPQSDLGLITFCLFSLKYQILWYAKICRTVHISERNIH